MKIGDLAKVIFRQPGALPWFARYTSAFALASSLIASSAILKFESYYAALSSL
jgi:hypothetical protein